MALNLRNKFIFIEILINKDTEYAKLLENQDFNFDNESEYVATFVVKGKPKVKYALIWHLDSHTATFRRRSVQVYQTDEIDDLRAYLERYFVQTEKSKRKTYFSRDQKQQVIADIQRQYDCNYSAMWNYERSELYNKVCYSQYLNFLKQANVASKDRKRSINSDKEEAYKCFLQQYDVKLKPAQNYRQFEYRNSISKGTYYCWVRKLIKE